jgi:transketolase
MFAVMDAFGLTGSPDQLMKHFHLTADDIVTAVERVLKRKR